MVGTKLTSLEHSTIYHSTGTIRIYSGVKYSISILRICVISIYARHGTKTKAIGGYEYDVRKTSLF